MRRMWGVFVWIQMMMAAMRGPLLTGRYLSRFLRVALVLWRGLTYNSGKIVTQLKDAANASTYTRYYCTTYHTKCYVRNTYAYLSVPFRRLQMVMTFGIVLHWCHTDVLDQHSPLHLTKCIFEKYLKVYVFYCQFWSCQKRARTLLLLLASGASKANTEKVLMYSANLAALLCVKGVEY